MFVLKTDDVPNDSGTDLLVDAVYFFLQWEERVPLTSQENSAITVAVVFHRRFFFQQSQT